MVKNTSKSGKKLNTSATTDDGPSSSSSSRAPITLRKKSEKKKSLSEIMNEQFDEEKTLYGSARGFEDEDGGVVEDYEAVEQADEDGLRSSLATGKKRMRSGSRAVDGAVPLRRRGPLDDSLSTGKYAATPISVEAAMDDLFGGLDMADLDEEADAFVDGGSSDDEDGELSSEDGDEKRSKREKDKKKKKKRVKDLSEEEYMAYLEEQGQKRKLKRTAVSKTTSGLGVSSSFASGADEMDVLQQLEELRANQMQLVKGVKGDVTGEHAGGMDGSSLEDEAERRQRIRDAVQYQIVVYSQLLRLRVKLQPAVMKTIAMPQYYSRSLFTAEPPRGEGIESEEDWKAVSANRKSILAKYKNIKAELQAFLARLFSDATAAMQGDGKPQKKKRKTEESDEEEEEPGVCPDLPALQAFHKKVIQHANHCLSFWGSRLAPSNNIANQSSAQKLQSIHQPITSQIEALLQSKSRLRIKVQKNRSHIPIIAHPEHLRASSWFVALGHGTENSSALEEGKTVRATRIAEGDVDEEIFDDGDFLRELVRRGGAVAAQLDQQLRDVRQEVIANSGGVTGEGNKKGFHRLTKGKSLDFNPRPKLVGFMVAEPWDSCNPPRSEVIVRSLFQ